MTDLLDLMKASTDGHADAERALAHADRVNPYWAANAYACVERYAASHGSFMAEDVRRWAHRDGLPAPPDSRAWGAVFIRASNAKLIKRTGFAQSKYGPGHARPMAVWQSMIARVNP